VSELDTILSRLSDLTPLREFKFGHSPLQLEHFQISSQKGNDKWEYWQHILQLRALQGSLAEMKVLGDELDYEIIDAKRFWPPWSQNRRRRSLPRLNLKKEQLRRSIAEKSQEALRHLEIIERRYPHLKDIKEEEILKDEASYWTMRLGRQLGAAHLGRLLGIPEGEVLAVLALPLEQQRQVFESMKLLIGASTNLLPKANT